MSGSKLTIEERQAGDVTILVLKARWCSTTGTWRSEGGFASSSIEGW
jgi:hypothetical protein